MALNEIISTGLNNPDCAFFVGQWLGGWLSMKMVMYLVVAYWIMKSIDKLALEPIIDFVKSKLFKQQKEAKED